MGESPKRITSDADDIYHPPGVLICEYCDRVPVAKNYMLDLFCAKCQKIVDRVRARHKYRGK